MLFSVFLIWKSSGRITDSLIPVAHKFGTSYIAVTTLVISFILSLPEIVSSLYAYMLGHLDIGIGIVIGSVMANVGLILGLSAIVRPLSVDKSIVVRDGIFMVVAGVVVLLFGSDLTYSRPEGLVLLLLFVPYGINVWAFERWRPKHSQTQKVKQVQKSLSLIKTPKIILHKIIPDKILSKLKLKPSLGTFIFSALVLIGGSCLFSFSLIELTNAFSLPGLLVGLVFGALGTSFPNIAAALQGTLKGYKDAAITETFGSNIFMLLITFGMIIVLSPFVIKGSVFYFDLTWMIILNLLLVAFIIKGFFYKEESLTRYEGIALLLFYAALIVIQVIWF